MLQNIIELWNELLLAGIGIWILALINVGIVTVLVRKKKSMSGAIVALIAGFLGQVSKSVFLIGMSLAVVKVILNFI